MMRHKSSDLLVADKIDVQLLAEKLAKKYWRGRKKPRIKVLDIGPDPPRCYKKYIWGRSSKFCVFDR